MKNTQSDIVEQVVRGAPAAAGAVATAVTLSEWVGIVTIVYIIIQTIYLGWKAAWERQEKLDTQAREARREAREERAVAAAEAREEARKRIEDRRTSAHSVPAPLLDIDREAV